MSPIDEGPSLEQMRAFLMSQGVFPQNAAFDDGVSLLGQNLDMQQVGFKVPKMPKILDIPHDPSRRTMGLTIPQQSQAPVVSQQSQASNLPAAPQESISKPPSINPLEYAAEAIKNMPMTRRQVLQTPLNAAVSHYGRKLLGPMESVAEPAAAAVPEAEMVLPTFSEEEIASKTGQYLGSLMLKPKFQKNYAKTYLANPDDEFFAENPEEMYTARDYHMDDADQVKQFASSDDAIGAFSKHLNLDQIAKETGIPVSEIEKYTSLPQLHKYLDYAAYKTGLYKGIIFDGRPKEAFRMTSLEEIDYKKLANQAAKEIGKNANKKDILAQTKKLVLEDFYKRENKVDLTDDLKNNSAFHNLAITKATEQFNKKLLKDVYDQAYDIVLDEIYNAVDSIRKINK